jgi:putative transposase
VDDHRERFGVEPICRVLTEHGIQIAPNSYYAHKLRPPSARALRDEQVLTEIVRVHTDPRLGRGLYGIGKVHAQLAREGGVDGSLNRDRQQQQTGSEGLLDGGDDGLRG